MLAGFGHESLGKALFQQALALSWSHIPLQLCVLRVAQEASI